MELQGRHKRDRTLSLEGKRARTCPGSEGERGSTGGAVSKVAGPCAESGGYEWDSKDGDDHRGWEDAMGSGGMSSREQGGQSGGPLTSVSMS